MKEYQLWQLILYPSLQILAGFAVTRRFGWAWDSAFILVTLCFLSVITGTYMLLYTLEQVLMVANWNADTPKREPVVVKSYVNEPKQMTTTKVRYDTER